MEEFFRNILANLIIAVLFIVTAFCILCLIYITYRLFLILRFGIRKFVTKTYEIKKDDDYKTLMLKIDKIEILLENLLKKVERLDNTQNQNKEIVKDLVVLKSEQGGNKEEIATLVKLLGKNATLQTILDKVKDKKL